MWFGALGLTALNSAGCSTSFPLGGAEKKQDDEPVHTGSIAGSAQKAVTANAASRGAQPAQAGPSNPPPADLAMPPAADLAFAERAAREALSQDAGDKSFSWENPASGARGTVTPLSVTYRIDGELCRDFLASHVVRGAETWLQGEACRLGPGPWEVRRMKPWRRT